jgi:hypothetical protein
MELKEIKKLNQDIYGLDTEITRNGKLIFIATLIFCSLENDFWDIKKLSSLINFNTSKSPVDDLINLAKTNIENKIKISSKTKDAIYDSLKIIEGVTFKLNNDRIKLQQFVVSFISSYLPSLKDSDNLFLETLFMEVDKKAKGSNEGITLTPDFASQLMIDLAELDYRHDIVTDLASGTGLFSLLSYSTMVKNLYEDKKLNKISNRQFEDFENRLFNSIIANDVDPKMVTLCLANFVMKKLNSEFIHNENIFSLQKTSFQKKNLGKTEFISPTKAILNPPYEDNYKPVEIILKNIELLKTNNLKDQRLIVIIPPQKFGQNKETFRKILDYSTLKIIIKMQDDLFTDSGQTPSTCIFVFDLDKEHTIKDNIRYFDFTDSGYIYLKDSGMVDKNKSHQELKKELLNKIKNQNHKQNESTFNRNWGNFFEVAKKNEFIFTIDPTLIATSKEEADITIENITIKRALNEKKKLIESVNNEYIDEDKSLEKYMIDILSEEV